MKLENIYNILNAEIPHALSDRYVAAYGGHDNSGILLNTGEEIERAVFSLDLSRAAIERAVVRGAKLIVTHHPAIYYPVSELSIADAMGKKLLDCAKNGISVVAMHLNADCAPRGVDYYLAQAAGASDEENVPVQPVEGGGYGRVFTIADITARNSQTHCGKRSAPSAYGFSAANKKSAAAASFCGAGVDGDTIKIAKERGAQALISADIKHNYICEALDLGMNVIELTHYASENYGFHKIYQNLKDKLGVASEYCDDGFML